MALPTETLIEKETKVNTEYFDLKFLKYKENWHNGETLKYENDLNEVEDIRYSQYKTVITDDNQEKKYFIYDEVINKNKPILFLRIFDVASDKYLETIIYLNHNEVIQQIKNWSYDQFFNEVKNGEDPIKLKETEDLTIIKTPFSDFIQNIYEEIDIINLDKINESISDSLWKKTSRIVLKFLVFITINAVGFGLVVLTGIITANPVSLALWAIMGSIVLGIIKIPWGNLQNEMMNWIGTKEICTSIVKSIKNFFGYTLTGLGIMTYQENNTQKVKSQLKSDKEKIKDLEVKNEQLKNELFLSLTPEAKQERILNAFQQIWEKNKTKDFETLWNELVYKFEENKKLLLKQELERKIQKGNQKIENFKKWSKSESCRKELENLYNNYADDEKINKHILKKWENFDEIAAINLTNNQIKLRACSPIKQVKRSF